MLETLDDKILLQRWQQHADKRVLGELFRRYSHLVLGVCIKYLKNQEESKDAVMEIFEKLHQDISKHEITYFKSWLHSVARNHCLMQLRKKGLQYVDNEAIIYENSMSLSVTPDYELEEKTNAEDSLNKCMETLKLEQKRCVELFYLQEKSYKEVMHDTGFDFNNVKSFIQNGKANLKKCMEKN